MNKSADLSEMLFFTLFLIMPALGYTQEIEDIDFGDTKFSVDLKMAKLSHFKKNQINWDFGKEEYGDTIVRISTLMYSEVDSEFELIFLFCNGKLYGKKYSNRFGKENYDKAKSLYDSLSAKVLSTYDVEKQQNYVIRNESYGEEIGEGKKFILNTDSEEFREISINLLGVLQMQDNNPDLLDVKDITIEVVEINLSYVPLNSNDGWTSF